MSVVASRRRLPHISRMLEILWFVRPILPKKVYEFLLQKLLNEFWKTLSIEEKVSPEELPLSERGVLLEAMFRTSSFSSVLEVGCGYGQNFWFLKRLLPNLKVTGVERGKELTLESKLIAEQLKLKKINFVTGDASKKLPFEDDTFDCSVLSAALLYVTADQIKDLLKEIIRVTKKKIFILEQHQEDKFYSQQDLGVWVSKGDTGLGYWLRDYKNLLCAFPELDILEIKKVPKPRFLGESWSDTAHLFVVEIAPKVSSDSSRD